MFNKEKPEQPIAFPVALSLVIGFSTVPSTIWVHNYFLSSTSIELEITFANNENQIRGRIKKGLTKDSFLIQIIETKEWIIVPLFSDHYHSIKETPREFLIEEKSLYFFAQYL